MTPAPPTTWALALAHLRRQGVPTATLATVLQITIGDRQFDRDEPKGYRVVEPLCQRIVFNSYCGG